MSELADKLNTAILCAAQDAGVQFIDVREAFDGHDVCAEQNWLHRIFGVDHDNERFHPNMAEQIGYANAVKTQIVSPSTLTCPSNRTLKAVPANNVGMSGKLHMEANLASCGLVFKSFVRNQIVRVVGSGFKPNSNVALRVRAGFGAYSESLSAKTTDADGRLDVLVQIPGDVPVGEEAEIKATGVTPTDARISLYKSFEVASSDTVDSDLDGVPNICDNCVNTQNTGQVDSDQDSFGDACDICPQDYENDWDQDDLCADIDPCPVDPYNDADGDGLCAEVDPDDDADGIADELDRLPSTPSNVCSTPESEFTTTVLPGETVTCAASSSISVKSVAEVQGGGHLELISPIVKILPGFIAERQSVLKGISKHPCPSCL